MDEEIFRLINSIRTKRKKLGISVDIIAQRERITRRTAYNWLNGKHLSDHRYKQKGRTALRRTLRWLERIEAGFEPLP